MIARIIDELESLSYIIENNIPMNHLINHKIFDKNMKLIHESISKFSSSDLEKDSSVTDGLTDKDLELILHVNDDFEDVNQELME